MSFQRPPRQLSTSSGSRPPVPSWLQAGWRSTVPPAAAVAGDTLAGDVHREGVMQPGMSRAAPGTGGAGSGGALSRRRAGAVADHGGDPVVIAPSTGCGQMGRIKYAAGRGIAASRRRSPGAGRRWRWPTPEGSGCLVLSIARAGVLEDLTSAFDHLRPSGRDHKRIGDHCVDHPVPRPAGRPCATWMTRCRQNFTAR